MRAIDWVFIAVALIFMFVQTTFNHAVVKRDETIIELIKAQNRAIGNLAKQKE